MRPLHRGYLRKTRIFRGKIDHPERRLKMAKKKKTTVIPIREHIRYQNGGKIRWTGGGGAEFGEDTED